MSKKRSQCHLFFRRIGKALISVEHLRQTLNQSRHNKR